MGDGRGGIDTGGPRAGSDPFGQGQGGAAAGVEDRVARELGVGDVGADAFAAAREGDRDERAGWSGAPR